jgi:hypothetical protein
MDSILVAEVSCFRAQFANNHNHINTIYQRPNEILKFVLEDAQSADLGRIETLLAGIEDMTALISYWTQHMVTNMRFRVQICPGALCRHEPCHGHSDHPEFLSTCLALRVSATIILEQKPLTKHSGW